MKFFRFSKRTVCDGLICIGFLLTVVGMAAADSEDLTFTVVTMGIGMAIMLIGRSQISEKNYRERCVEDSCDNLYHLVDHPKFQSKRKRK